MYSEITKALASQEKLVRVCIQASAGTGKSFLLETLYLWCLVQDLRVSACAPTGIAAARIHVPRTPVHAYTLHYLLGLNVSLESTLDASTLTDEKTGRLARTQVLFTDEASMIDDVTWASMKDQLSTVAAVADTSGEDRQGRSKGAPSLSVAGRGCPGRRLEPLRRPGGAPQERAAAVSATVRAKTSVSGSSEAAGPRARQVRSSQKVV